MAETFKKPRSPSDGRRRFLGVHFRCCNIYLRIYTNREGTAYTGRCPRCGKNVCIPIGEGGVDSRFFEAQ